MAQNSTNCSIHLQSHVSITWKLLAGATYGQRNRPPSGITALFSSCHRRYKFVSEAIELTEEKGDNYSMHDGLQQHKRRKVGS